MTNEFQRGAGEAIHEAAAHRFDWSPGGGVPGGGGRSFFLDSNNVELEDIGGGDDEVRDWAQVVAARRPVGVEAVGGGDRRDARSEVGARLGDEAGTAGLDSGWIVHHLVGGVAHLWETRVFGRENDDVEELEEERVQRVLLSF